MNLLLKTLLSGAAADFPRQLLMDLVWENALETLERNGRYPHQNPAPKTAQRQ